MINIVTWELVLMKGASTGALKVILLGGDDPRCEPVIEYALKCLGMEGVPSAIDQRTLLGVNLCIVALVGMDGVVLSRQAFPGFFGGMDGGVGLDRKALQEAQRLVREGKTLDQHSQAKRFLECVLCGKMQTATSSIKLSKCARCLKVAYCSRECQKTAWKTHKRSCKPHEQAGGPAPTTVGFIPGHLLDDLEGLILNKKTLVMDVTASEIWPLDLLRLALAAGVDVAVSLADKPHDDFLSPFFECLDETFQPARLCEYSPLGPQHYAFLQGGHPRLGASSPISTISAGLRKHVLSFVPRTRFLELPRLASAEGHDVSWAKVLEELAWWIDRQPRARTHQVSAMAAGRQNLAVVRDLKTDALGSGPNKDIAKFLVAIIYGDAEEAAKLLAAKPSLLHKNCPYTEMTPLQWALRAQRSSCVDLLLEEGADVDIPDGCAQTNALIEAVQSCTYVFPWSDKVRARRMERSTALLRKVLAAKPNVNLLPPGWRKQSGVLACAGAMANLEAVKLLLESGAKVDHVSIDGFTPLVSSLQEDDPAVIQLLLKAGARINGAGNRKPLVMAISAKAVNCVRVLMESGADPNLADDMTGPPVFAAIMEGTNEICDLVLGNRRTKLELKLKGYGVTRASTQFAELEGVTPAMAACALGNSHALKLLLGRGISLKNQGMSSNGFDVLMWCCDRRFTTNAAGKLECGRLVLSHVPLKTSLDRAVFCGADGDDLHMDAMDMAANDYGESDMVRVLLDAGWPASRVKPAACAGTPQLRPQGKFYGRKGKKPIPSWYLCVAIGSGQLDNFDLLLERGANILERNHYGSSILHVASYSQKLSLAQLKYAFDKFTAAGGVIDDMDPEGCTPLTKGIIGGRTEIIEFLIQNGAKVNHAEHDGMRAMHKAALLGDVPMIQLLARYGAKVNCRSLNNVRPIELAAQHGHHDAVEAFVRLGAKPLPPALMPPRRRGPGAGSPFGGGSPFGFGGMPGGDMSAEMEEMFEAFMQAQMGGGGFGMH